MMVEVWVHVKKNAILNDTMRMKRRANVVVIGVSAENVINSFSISVQMLQRTTANINKI